MGSQVGRGATIRSGAGPLLLRLAALVMYRRAVAGGDGPKALNTIIHSISLSVSTASRPGATAK